MLNNLKTAFGFFTILTLGFIVPDSVIALPIQTPSSPVIDHEMTLEAVQNPLSIEEALRTFNRTGDIRYLPSLPQPRSSAKTEEKALYAMSLAVRGNDAEALRQIGTIPTKQFEFLVNLVKAQVAKNRGDWSGARRHLNSAKEHKAEHPYIYLLEGQMHYAKMELEAAKTSFQQALLFNPDLAVAESNLAATFLMEGNSEKALELYEDALTKRPSFCPALHGKALINYEQSNLGVAEQMLQSCLTANPEFTQARLLLANIAIERNRPEKALEHVADLNSLEAQRIEQQSYLMLGNIEALIEGVKASPQGRDIALDYINALVYAFIGDYEKANSLLMRLEEKTGNSTIFGDLSYSVKLLSNSRPIESESTSNSRSIAALLAALTSNSPEALNASSEWYDGLVIRKLARPENVLMPKNEAGELGLSLLLMNERATDLALRKLNEINTDSDPNVLIQHFRSRQLLALGERERAEKTLKKVLNKEPLFFSANVLAADLAAAKSDFDSALRLLENANEAYKAPGVVLKLGILNERLGNIFATESYYKELIDLLPESHIPYNQLAWFYATHNLKLAEALELAQKANSILPGNVSTMDTLGWLHHLQSDNAEALKWLEKADEAASRGHPGIKYRKAKVLADLGRQEKALAEIDELLSSSENQSNKYRDEALKLRQELEHL